VNNKFVNLINASVPSEETMDDERKDYIQEGILSAKKTLEKQGKIWEKGMSIEEFFKDDAGLLVRAIQQARTQMWRKKYGENPEKPKARVDSIEQLSAIEDSPIFDIADPSAGKDFEQVLDMDMLQTALADLPEDKREAVDFFIDIWQRRDAGISITKAEQKKLERYRAKTGLALALP
jgi:hypothetical protein